MRFFKTFWTLLLLSVINVFCDGDAAAVGQQWSLSDVPSRSLEQSFHVSGATLSDGESVYIVGTHRSQGCWWASLDVETLELAFFQDIEGSNTKEVCHALTVDPQDDSLWVTGHSQPGGLLSLIEGETLDPNTLLYGMLVNVEFEDKEEPGDDPKIIDADDEETANTTDTNSTGAATRYLRGLAEDGFGNGTGPGVVPTLPGGDKKPDLISAANVTDDKTVPEGPFNSNRQAIRQGGVIIDGKARISPVAVAASLHHVYIASMVQKQTRNDTAGLTTQDIGYHSLRNPTMNLAAKGPYTLAVTAYKKKDNRTEGVFEETLGDLNWETMLVPDEDLSIGNVAGILVLDDIVLVAGSTSGGGEHAFGVDAYNDDDDGEDMDGFVTKLVRSSGQFYKERQNETTDDLSSVRIESEPGLTDFIYGMCVGDVNNQDFAYITGSTEGTFPFLNRTIGSNFTKAYLMKIEVATMDIVAALELPAHHAPVAGVSCVVDGDVVYFGGNVDTDGRVKGVEQDAVGGLKDIFLAKVDVAGENDTMELAWVRQIGSSADEVMAPRGGLAVLSNGNIVVVGNTAGSLYRTGKKGPGLELFVAVVTPDGELPMAVSSEKDTNSSNVPLPNADDTTTTPEAPTPEATTTATEEPTTTSTAATELSPASPTQPAGPAQEFEFVGLTMRLNGAPKLKKESRQAFEDKTEEFYRTVYLTAVTRNRNLQEVEFTEFETTVVAVEESADDQGNTITYNQKLSFTSAVAGKVTEDQARGIILAPFFRDDQKQDYLTMLGEGHPDLGAITSTDAPKFAGDEENDAEKDNSGGLDIMLFVYIGAGVLVCCICSGLFWMRQKKSGGKDKQFDPNDDIDEHDNYDQPEQPRDSYHDDIKEVPARMSFTAEPEIFQDELGLRGTGPTAGFGNDFDHPEKASNGKLPVHDDDFGFGSADLGGGEDRPRADSFDSNGSSSCGSNSHDGDDSEDGSRSGSESGLESGSESKSGSHGDDMSSFAAGDDESSEGDRFV